MKKLSATEKAVLTILKENTKGTLNINQIYQRFSFEQEISKDIISKVLLSLSNQKLIEQPSKGHYRAIAPVETYIATVEYTRRGEILLFPKNSKNTEPWYTDGNIGMPVLPGDVVEFSTQKKGKSRNLRIERILETGNRTITGQLDVFEGKAYLIPDKANFPLDVKLEGKFDPGYDGQKAAVKLLGFDKQGRYPLGELIDVLGKQGSNDAEMHAIVVEFGFKTRFDADTESETAFISEEINAQEAKSRTDLRGICTFTIDPADAKDFDDAISFEKTTDGNYRIGVHIADVAHFVKPNSALDKEAFFRGTSVYLVDRTIPMLPEKLSNHLCSLRPNEDKLAFSVFLRMDQNAKVLAVEIAKTIIHSQKRFSYEQAQELIEGKAHDESWSGTLQEINQLAKHRTAYRKKHGSLGFESEEIRFKLDEHGKPLELFKKARFDAHKLIEEFMLLANQEVARYVWEKKKPPYPFIYRIHDQPNQEKLIDLMNYCKLFGYKLDISTDKNLRNSLNALMEQSTGKPEEHVIHSSAIRSMAKAVYSEIKKEHFGLAFQFYSHFTSPIRRYPDLLAHRLLWNIIQNKSNTYTETAIAQIAKHSSNMEQKAAEAERASTKYKMAEFMESKKGQVFDAVITGVTEWGIYAEIEENYCEGLIRFADVRFDHFVFVEKEKKAVGKRTKRTFRIGDPVSIRVKNSNAQLRQIDFYLEK